jgi:hypothetical protein
MIECIFILNIATFTTFLKFYCFEAILNNRLIKNCRRNYVLLDYLSLSDCLSLSLSDCLSLSLWLSLSISLSLNVSLSLSDCLSYFELISYFIWRKNNTKLLKLLFNIWKYLIFFLFEYNVLNFKLFTIYNPQRLIFQSNMRSFNVM